MISIREKIDSVKVQNAIKKIARVAPDILREAFIGTSLAIQRYLRTEKMTGGTTDDKLAVRSGRLRSSVRPLTLKQKDKNILQAGVSVGTRYAVTHIGKRGSSITIRPKVKRCLTIPLTKVKGGATTFRKSKKVTIKRRIAIEDVLARMRKDVMEKLYSRKAEWQKA